MSNRSLLVIEDDRQVADLVCRVATEAGFIARSASGVHAIVATYNSLQPDVIVLDIVMPEMDGIEVLQYLRDQNCRAHIIIMSDNDDLSYRLAQNLGAGLNLPIVATVNKPFRVNQLRSLFENIKIPPAGNSHAEKIA